MPSIPNPVPQRERADFLRRFRRAAGRLLPVALAACGAVHAAGTAQAEGYPGKPVTIVVNFPPGGGAHHEVERAGR